MNARINPNDEKEKLDYNQRYSRDNNKRIKNEYIDEDGHKVTNFKDGTSRVHFGGPCGPADFDEFGNQM